MIMFHVKLLDLSRESAHTGKIMIIVIVLAVVAGIVLFALHHRTVHAAALKAAQTVQAQQFPAGQAGGSSTEKPPIRQA